MSTQTIEADGALALFPAGADAASPPYRSMPANEQAEQALLGAILIDNRALERVSEFLRPDHFFYPAHGRIYAACEKLRDLDQVADPVTLRHLFERDGDLQKVGGADYLTALAGSVVSVLNAADYGRTIYDLYLRRALITLGEEVVNEAFDGGLDVNAGEQIRQAEDKLYRLAQVGDLRGGFRPFRDLVRGAVDAAGRAQQRNSQLTGITTGFIDLDRMLGGLQRSDLVILAGRPSMGKTALATNVAVNAARAFRDSDGVDGAVVGFFSLEMSAEQLATRIIADTASIPSEKIRKGDLSTKTEFPKIVEASNEIATIPFFVDDTAALSITALRSRALRLKRQHNLGMLVIDYLQLMQPSGVQRSDNRVQEVSEITRGLKMVAKDLDVPVLALSQLSRQVEQREDKRPQLSDLRESGSIEQDADVVMFVFRDAYYVEKRQPKPGTPEHVAWQTEMDSVHNLAEVIVAKQRHGPTGKVDLHFDGLYTRFSNIARQPERDF
ncbi:MAG: replicative DNA helicase [Alphaproteobacteria bacterium]|jgi:replicative DNA helicase|nr:replicative DNA helicase [Alphaproteobacteria bacterium]